VWRIFVGEKKGFAGHENGWTINEPFSSGKR